TPAGALHVAPEGLDPRGAEPRGDDAFGRRVRVAAEDAVRGGVREARGRSRGRPEAGGARVNWARASEVTFVVALLAYLASMVASFAYVAYRNDRLATLSRVIAIGGLAVHLFSIVSRGVAAGHVPWGTMFEYSSLLSFLVILATLVIVEGLYKV